MTLDIQPRHVESMTYNDLIGLVRETNRPPGGYETIYQLCSRSFITSESTVLDVGTATGATALEIAARVGCRVVGIDINPESIQEARRRAVALNLSNAHFQVADARNLPWEDESFDLVMCGNVNSLIDDSGKATDEYCRVAREGGYLAAVPMWYHSDPPADLVSRVRDAIGVRIPVLKRTAALRQFSLGSEWEPLETVDFLFGSKTPSELERYCGIILQQPHLRELSAETEAAVRQRYLEFMHLFRDNLSYMGFTICLFRKARWRPDPELFTAIPVSFDRSEKGADDRNARAMD